MAMTETRPAPESATSVVAALVPPPERAGLAGWLTTSDHKQIGRLYVVTALVLGIVTAVVGTILAAEATSEGFDIVDANVFLQLFTLHQEAAVWLFAVPLLLGLATFIVPMQIGSPEIAFPRGAATAYWTYLVGAGLLLGAYAADGGPAGTEGAAVDLHLLALAALTVALSLGSLCVITTVLTLRAPGMSLVRVPAFSWSVVVAGGLTLLSTPVLLARVIVLFVTHHFGGDYGIADYGGLDWAYSVPQLYLVAVPAAGVVLDVVPVLARNRMRRHEGVLVVLSLLGIVSIGAWAQVPSTFDQFLYVALGLVAVVPALAMVGLVGDTLRGGQPALKASLLFAGGSALLLLLGTGTGALSAIDGLDLRGTVWEAATFHLVVFGAAGLGALGGLWWWAPKLYGSALPEGAGVLSFLAVFGGTLAVAAAGLVNGLTEDVPLASGGSPDSIAALDLLAVAGSGLLVLGLLVALAVVVRTSLRATSGPADPWGGHTLEWATASPPVATNFAVPVGTVTSATPLLDGLLLEKEA
jgi:cytochrome c oxidase subunit I